MQNEQQKLNKKVINMIKIGQKVRCEPLKDIKKLNVTGEVRKEVTGTVVYVNKPHKWLSVEYVCNTSGVKMRASYKFSQIGQDVILCGN